MKRASGNACPAESLRKQQWCYDLPMGARVRGGWLAGVLSVRAVPSIRAILFIGAVLCVGFVPGFMAKAAAGRCGPKKDGEVNSPLHGDAKKDGEVNSPLHGDSKEAGSRSGWEAPTRGGVNATAKGAAQEGTGEKNGSKDPPKAGIRQQHESKDPVQNGIRQKNESK